MNERVRAPAVWREALATVLRDPVAAIAPALLLGTLSETPYLLPEDRSSLEALSAFVTESLAFYLYVAYAELMASEVGRGPGTIPLSTVLRNLLLAAPVVPVVAVASLAAIALPTAAASVLVIPGLWLMTRWSLFAPVIVRELLGPLAALRRSNELVRGHFEPVFLTASFAVVLEEAVADAGRRGYWRSPARRSGENGWEGRSPPWRYCPWRPSRPRSRMVVCGARRAARPRGPARQARARTR